MENQMKKNEHHFCYYNGDLKKLGEISISPNDRGFVFADGVYEVIRYYKGKSFAFPQHIERLKRSLSEISLTYNQVESLENISDDLIIKNNLQKEMAGIYIQITRGVYPRMHAFPPDTVKPSVFVNAFQFTTQTDVYKNGVPVLSTEDIRWHRCDIKTIALLPNTLLFQKAKQEGAEECIFVRNGAITEASHCNVFGVKNGIVYTHPANNLILHGITRAIITDICKEMNIPLKEEPILTDKISQFDEFFLAGTGNEIMPIIKIDGLINWEATPGVITRILQNRYFELTYDDLAGIKVRI